jgi:hypothetical protein
MNNDERQTRVVTLHQRDIYGSAIKDDYGADDLRDFIAFFQGLLAKVPVELVSSAKVEIESYCEYDSSRAQITVYYERPETDEEMAARLSERLAAKAREAERERAAYEHLKAKFEGKA